MAVDSGTDIASTWGFHDAAKALRELLRVLDDLGRRAGGLYGLYTSRKRRKAASDLAYLHFPEGGSLKHVQRIANGTFDASDLAAIRRQLNKTNDPVREAIARLMGYSKLIREKVGFKSLIQLERLIDGQYGKTGIRGSLQALGRLDGAADREEVQERGKFLVKMIEEFNNGLVELHDLILQETAQKKKSTSARSRKKTVRKKS